MLCKDAGAGIWCLRLDEIKVIVHCWIKFTVVRFVEVV